jgi:hypothetical protein
LRVHLWSVVGFMTVMIYKIVTRPRPKPKRKPVAHSEDWS